jgi:hypothetical protein
MKNKSKKYSSLKERFRILKENSEDEKREEREAKFRAFSNAIEENCKLIDPNNSEEISKAILNMKISDLKRFLNIANENSSGGGGDPENKGPEKAKSVEDIISGMTDDEKNSSGINAETHKKLIGFLREKGVIA